MQCLQEGQNAKGCVLVQDIWEMCCLRFDSITSGSNHEGRKHPCPKCLVTQVLIRVGENFFASAQFVGIHKLNVRYALLLVPGNRFRCYRMCTSLDYRRHLTSSPSAAAYCEHISARNSMSILVHCAFRHGNQPRAHLRPRSSLSNTQATHDLVEDTSLDALIFGTTALPP